MDEDGDGTLMSLLIVYSILFLATASLALGVLLNRNTVRSAMCLVGVMICLAANYLLMYQEFVAYIQILVYAGAIMVLFLFVIMLLNLKEAEILPWYLRNARFWGGILAVLFFLLLGFGIKNFHTASGAPRAVANQAELAKSGTAEVMVLATKMMTTYIAPFILTSVLLLVAVIGAIVMARRRDEDGNEIVLDPE
ncbi:NADH-quinone oxidoreductase subunit J, partial [Candidatus Sumerlaeota bacterium]|nr:NADH-quinone oxidoreductase subunit J [Candidatus Sumerlaeota bacterium]